MHLSERLARFICETSYEGVPEAARDKAKQCILDCVGVTIAGSREAIVTPLLSYLDVVGGNEDCTLIGQKRKTSVTTAALLNGVMSHVLDFDDTNQIFIGHPSASIVSAILSLAEKHSLGGRDVIGAYMVGTQVQWRLGEALVDAGDHYAKGWHSTCTVGGFGAAAAAAKLLGLDERKTAHAIGIAASEAAGFQEQFGTHCKPFHAGRSNEIGVRAAILARSGFTSSPTALEGKVGYLKLVADKYDLSKLENPGQPWGILEASFGRGINLKRHPVCASGIGSVEGMQSLIAEHKLQADDIESIDCGIRPGGMNILMYHAPENALQAKFSVEYWMAATLIDGDVGLRQVTDANVQRPEIRELMKKVRVYGDPAIHVSKAHVKISVKTRDGRTLEMAYCPPKGAPDNPLSERELLAKFHDCAEWGGFPRGRAEGAARMLLELETVTTMRELMAILAGP